VIALAIITGLLRLKRQGKAEKMLIILLILTLSSEIMAYIWAVKFRNNFPVYHIFAPIQLFFVSMYFHYSVDSLSKSKIAIYIGLSGGILAAVNTIFFQPITTLNSYFLLFEGLCTIFLSLYAFNKMFINDNLNILSIPHFWFTLILLTFWSITYISWGVYEFMRAKQMNALYIMGAVLWAINIITYLGIGFVFFFISKRSIQRE
jgi:hypothetical protein